MFVTVFLVEPRVHVVIPHNLTKNNNITGNVELVRTLCELDAEINNMDELGREKSISQP